MVLYRISSPPGDTLPGVGGPSVVRSDLFEYPPQGPGDTSWRDPEDLPWSDQIAAWNRLLHSAGRQGSANLQLEFGIWNMLLYRVFRLA